MPRISTQPVPRDTLLAQRMLEGDYGDSFVAEVSGDVSLAAYIVAFYSSLAFRPERTLLGLIGRGASAADVKALAAGTAETFAAWSVEARADDQILLRDFMGQTRSWLKVEPLPSSSKAVGRESSTRLLFGSGVGRSPGSGEASAIGRAIFTGLMPFHRFYARQLLAGAVRELGA